MAFRIVAAAGMVTSETQLSKGYDAVRNVGAGLLDLSGRGRVLVSGSDALMFLNGLITNDMKTLALDSWMPAAFPNVQGRLLASVRVLHTQDGYLIDTEEATHQTVFQLLERFTLAGDFRVNDLSEPMRSVSLQGGSAPTMVQDVFGDEVAKLERGKVATANLKSGAKVTVICATHTAEEGFDFFLNKDDTDELWEEFWDCGAKTVSEETAELLRIEAGIPRYAVDMDQSTVVTETNLDDVVSFTKGCYIGQEIIVRIKHRGHIAKKLTGILLPDEQVNLDPGTKIFNPDGEEIGRVTSSAISPQLGHTVALAYVKFDYLKLQMPIQIQAEERTVKGVVAPLPLVRGSWFDVTGDQLPA